MTAFLLAVVAGIAALAGGYAALRGRRRLNLTLGFTAGLILGLVSFDLLPEIFEIASETGLDPLLPMIALTVGFLTFHVTEKFILIHHAQEKRYGPHRHPHVGVAGALAFAAHSFLDGLSIGLAFQLNSAVGGAVAIAVIGHRFADGFNTTNMMLYHQNRPQAAKRLLALAAAAPIVGALTTMLFSVSAATLAVYLGFFAGFILYIGASDILPQAHSGRSSYKVIAATVLGVLAMFFVTRLV